ncbi:MAG: DHH family phosphoesterase [candidate division SR1 bacterium]|nr:DHH family phosphoesterase [candidate division SR1 bacterium]
MNSNFFYSSSTGLYVSRKPLKIDSRVKKAAEKFGITLQWDDEGRIHYVDFDSSRKILSSLGSCMLSPVEYWKVLRDAEKTGDDDMVHELMSDCYCERLDRTYFINTTRIDHPTLLGDFSYSGKRQKAVEPVGKPGRFTPANNINYRLGIPKKISLFREKFSTSWKYWSPDFSVTAHRPRSIIRGYVTSVGKPSFDQGIPVDARESMMMIRECRKKPLESPIPEKILQEAIDMLNLYSKGKKDPNALIVFLKNYGTLFRTSKQLSIYKIRENFFDVLGLLKIEAITKNNSKQVTFLDKAGERLGHKIPKISYKDFEHFVTSSKSRLSYALKNKQDIVFVMGHKNPDTDTVVSCLLESWRNHVLDGGAVAYIPIVQNHKIPDEVRALLGDTISNHIVLHTESLYIKTKESGLARWISVDQNREPEVQKYFVSIIDHHIPSEVSLVQDIPKTMEIIGSCTALIVAKMIGACIYPDYQLAKIMHGATLMDTENRNFYKMTKKDILIMNYVQNISGVENEDAFYAYLMSFLLNTDDPDILFGRDYKEDRGFGFAVAKIKNGFVPHCAKTKKILLQQAVSLAKKNNRDKNLPLTLVKITDYHGDNITVNKERIYLVFNDKASQNFIHTMFELIQKIVQFEFGQVYIKTTVTYVEFWGTGMQLSRKKTAPVLEPIVKAYNEYFYSPSNKLWIKRDFLKKSHDLVRAMKQGHLTISFDQEKRVNYLSYPETKLLARKLDFLMLSTKEYWLTLRDAKDIQDIQMIESLQGSNFVEFWDTIFQDSTIMIEHPKIFKKGDTYTFEGERVNVKIPKGKPGLIHPDAIDYATGIPKTVRPPSEYGNRELRRYREPDAAIVNPTRSYIFLLKQPCRDGKFHINDSLPNLGIRPCCKKLTLPKVTIRSNKKHLIITITKEGDHIIYNRKK